MMKNTFTKAIALLLVLIITLGAMPAGFSFAEQQPAEQLLEQETQADETPVEPQITETPTPAPTEAPTATPSPAPTAEQEQPAAQDELHPYLTFEAVDGGIALVGCAATVTQADVPATWNNAPVLQINRHAFLDCTELETVTVAEGVLTIDSQAFSGCTALVRVELPATVLDIADDAFENCNPSLVLYAPADSYAAAYAEQHAMIETETDPTDPTDPTTDPTADPTTDPTADPTVAPTTAPTLTLATLENQAFVDGKATLTVQAECAEGVTPTYQWQYATISHDGSMPDDAWLDMADETTPELSFECADALAFVAYQYNRYRCVVTAGDESAISNTAMLHMQADWELADDGELELLATTVASGTCGTNVTWTLDSNGLLVVTGTGAMNSYSGTNQPWYSNRASIKNVRIESGVTSVGNYAFSGCTSLVGVTLPSKLNSIGNYAFYGCTLLAKIEIPETVTSIGNYAFWNCPALTELTLPPNLKSLGYGILSGNTKVKQLTIPQTLTSVGRHQYGGGPLLGSAVETVELGNGLTSVPAYLFEDGAALKSVNIPESVTSIGIYSFAECTSLVSVTLPNKLNSIGNYAFYGCTLLAKIDIPESVTSIGNYAFWNCPALTELTLPPNLKSLGYGILSGNTKVKQLTIPQTLTSVGRHQYGGGPLLGSAVETVELGNGFTSVPAYLFEDGAALKSVNIPESVTSIGIYSFAECTSLVSVTLPNKLNSIGNYAFYGCTLLAKIDIPESVTSIGNYAFWNCPALTELTLPPNLKSLGYGILSGNTKVKQLTIPQTLTSVGRHQYGGGPLLGSAVETVELGNGLTSVPAYLFEDGAALKSVNIPESVTSIGIYSFAECTSLVSVTLPNKLNSIGNYAFYGCTLLAKIEIPETVTSIGNYAFWNCPALTELTLPPNLQSLGYCILNGSAGVKQINIPQTLTSVGRSEYSYGPLTGSGVETVELENGITAVPDFLFLKATALTSVSFPESVTRIGNNAFRDCTSLPSVTLPANLSTIGYNAFYGCTVLAKVEIPETVTSIGYQAFASCKALTSLTLPPNLQSLGYSILSNNTGVKQINIPKTLTSVGRYEYSYGPLTGSGVETVELENGITAVPDFLFLKATALTSVSFPESVTRIGNNAFRDCTSLPSVTLPANLSTIGYNAFYGCSLLAKIDIPQTVTGIDDYAFANCTTLTELTLPTNLQSLGYCILNGSAGVKQLTIPKALTTAEVYSAKGPLAGSGVETVELENGITSVPDYLFENATTVTSVSIPESVTSIGTYAFYNCTSLPSVKLPSGLDVIGRYAFSSCTLFTKIEIPQSVTSIGDYAFANCNALTEVLNPQGSATIGNNAFYNCTALTTISMGRNTVCQNSSFTNCPNGGTFDEDWSWTVNYASRTITIVGSGKMPSFAYGEAPWYGLRGFALDVVLDCDTQNIGNYAFSDFVHITDLSFTDAIQTIGQGAYMNCTSLETVDMGTGLTAIEGDAFKGCTGLKQITFLGQPPQLGDHAIPNLSGLVLYVPETATGWTETLAAHCPNATLSVWDDTLQTRDIVLVVDVSGSMVGERIQTLRQAASAFVKRGGGRVFNTRIALIAYESSATVLSGLTWDNSKLLADIETLNAYGGTEYLVAMNAAANLLAGSRADVRAMVLFSDGEPNDSEPDIRSLATQLRKSYTIYTVGLSPSSSARSLLVDIAGEEGRYCEAANIGQLVDSFGQLAQDAGNEQQEVSSDSYYSNPEYRHFRVHASGTTYPAFAGFTITVDGTSYKAERNNDTGTDDIDVYIPVGYTGDVVIEKEGYHTLAMPASIVDLYTYITMYPETVKDPFAQLLFQHEKLNIFDSVLGSEYPSHIYETSLTNSATTAGYYVKINWNGHGEGKVWLEQADEKIMLTDGELVDVEVPVKFKADRGDVYLCWRANDGTKGKCKTEIRIKTKKESMAIDLGDKVEVSGEDMASTGLFSEETLSCDFGGLLDPKLPLEFTVKPDGVVEGTIGLAPIAETSATQTARDGLKEAFAAYKRDNTNDRQLSKELNKLREEGSLEGKSASIGVKGKVYLFGIFTGKLDLEGVHLTEIQIYLSFEGSKTWTQRFMVGSVPGFWKVTMGAKTRIGPKLEFDAEHGKLVGAETALNTKLSLSAEVGPGWEGFLSLSGYCKGTVGIETVIPFAAAKTKAYVESEVGGIGTFCGMSGQWTVWKSPKKYFYKNGVFAWTDDDKQQATEVRFIPIVEEKSHMSVFSETAQADETSDYPVIKTDTSTFSDPQLLTLSGGKKLLVWVDDVEGRGVIDAPALHYSYYDGDSWSTPELINDDGTNDYGARLKQVGDTVYVVWHDYSQTFGDSVDGDQIQVMNQTMDQIDISIATFDVETGEMGNKHTFTNPGYDTQPSIGTVDGVLTVEWKNGIDNPDNDQTSTPYQAALGDGQWSVPASASEESTWYDDGKDELPDDYDGEANPLYNNSNLQNLENGALRAVTYIKEDDAGTDNVFAVFNDGNGWGLPIQLTSVTGIEFVESFSASMDDAGNISIAANVRQGEQGAAKLAYFTYSAGLDVEIVEADYERFSLTDGVKTVFYAEAKNNSPFTAERLKIRLLDENGTILRTQMCSASIAAGDTERLTISYELPEDLTYTELTLKVISVEQTDINEANNVKTVSLMPVDASVENVYAYTNEVETTVGAYIVNRGRTPIESTPVHAYLNAPDGELIATGQTGVIEPGDVEIVSMNVGNVDEGSIIYVTVDDLPGENLYGNNTGLANVVSVYDEKPNWVESLTIVGAQNVAMGRTETFGVVVNPTDATNPSVEWSIVEGNDLATIDPNTGVLTAGETEGVVTIKAIAVDRNKIEATYSVNIVDYGIAITGPTTLTSKQSATLAATFVPYNLTGSRVVWSLAQGDEAYATLSSAGVLKALNVTQKQTVTVYAAASDGVAKSGVLQVDIVPLATSVQLFMSDDLQGGSINGQTLPMQTNGAPQTIQLTANVLPEDAADAVTWKSSAPKVATVSDNGLVTAVGNGTATIAATAADGSKKAASLKVAVTTIPKGVSVGNKVLSIQKDRGTLQLQAVFEPATTSNKQVVWSVTNGTGMAKVDAKGRLTAIRNGEVTVRVSTPDGSIVSEPVTITLTNQTSYGLLYGPKLSAATITINTWQTRATTMDIVPLYETNVVSAALSDTNFTITRVDDTNEWRVQSRTQLKGKYKMNLSVQVDDGETYDYAVTVSITNTAPKVTLKVPTVNLFYPEQTYNMTAKCNVAKVTELLLSYDGETSALAADWEITQGNVLCLKDGHATKPVVTGKVWAVLDGYETVSLTAKLKTTTKAAKLKATLGSVALNKAIATAEGAPDSARQATFYVYDSADKKKTPLTDITVSLTGAEGTVTVDDNGLITLTLDEAWVQAQTKTQKLTLSVKKAEWSSAVQLSVPVSFATANPTVKLSASSAKLSKNQIGEKVTLQLTCNQPNVAITGVDITPADGPAVFTLNGNRLEVALASADAAPGTYAYTILPTLSSGTELKPIKFKLSVTALVPTLKVSIKGKPDVINRQLGVVVTPKLTNTTDSIESLTLEQGADVFELDAYNAATGTAVLRMKESVVHVASTKYTVTFKATLAQTGQMVESAAVRVAPTQSTPKVTFSPSKPVLYYQVNTVRNTKQIAVSTSKGSITSMELVRDRNVPAGIDATYANGVITLTLDGNKTVKPGNYTLQFKMLLEGHQLTSGAQKPYTVKLTAVVKGTTSDDITTKLAYASKTAMLVAGESITPAVQAYRKDGAAVDVDMLFVSSNPRVATVNAQTGEITAVAKGKTKITAYALDGSKKSASITVTVTVEP